MVSHAIDREAFQLVLASAYAVQQSGIDAQCLSTFLEIQRLLSERKATADVVLQLIAECARMVSNASGSAIGVLEAREIVYRACTGSAAAYLGHHVTAVLGVASGNNEIAILRVENAEADKRIEAAICRQLDSMSLLILPLRHEHLIVGLIEIRFNEPHTFTEGEVCTYRTLAQLAEQSIAGAAQLQHSPPAIQHAIAQVKQHWQRPLDENLPAGVKAPELWGAAARQDAAKLPPGFPLSGPLKKMPAGAPIPAKHDTADGVLWVVATATAIVALVLAYGVSRHQYSTTITDREATRASEAPRLSDSRTIPSSGSSPRASQSRQRAPAAPQTTGGTTLGPAFRRVRISQNEIDYVAYDVTVRHFTAAPLAAPVRRTSEEVRIAEDVTVRYFNDRPAVSPNAPASSTQKSVGIDTKPK